MTNLRQMPKDARPLERIEWIKTQLRLRGTNLRQLAARHGLGSQVMYLALRAPHARAEGIIADALDMKPADLFPDRYTPDGTRLHRVVTRRSAA